MIKGVTYILKNDSGVQSLLGLNRASTKYKVFPVICSQEEVPPYSVVRMTSKVLAHKGTGGSNRNKFEVEFTVSSYHKSYDEVDQLDYYVTQALVPYRGTANSIAFDYIEFTGSSDDYTDSYDGLYIRNTTFRCCVSLSELT